MRSHTPGPWEVSETDDGHEIRMGSALESRASWYPQHKIEYEHFLDCELEDDAEAYKEAEANARLIAAAPDLLAALQLILDSSIAFCQCAMEIHGAAVVPPGRKCKVCVARDAIAKAEGREVPK